MARKDLAYYESLPYRTDLYFDAEDGVWFVTFPELPGCKAHGATREEALAAGDEIKSLWLETALEKRAQVPEPAPEPTYSGKFGLRIPKSLHERAAKMAAADGVSLNTFAVQSLAEAVERAGQKAIIRYVEGALTKLLRFWPGSGSGTVKVTVERYFGDDDHPEGVAEYLSVKRQTPSIASQRADD
jgi:antitoxin HicB